MALPKRTMMSVEEYLQFDEYSDEARYEYIDGHLRMLAGGTANHAMISIDIAVALSLALVGKPCGVYSSDMRVQLSESRYVYPDITVACDEQPQGDDKILLSPRLVVEVLSPSTLAYDQGEKFGYYRDCPTIQEYLLVNTQCPFIKLFRREKNNFWSKHIFEHGDEVELASLEVRFPVGAVYRRIKFSDRHGERDV